MEPKNASRTSTIMNRAAMAREVPQRAAERSPMVATARVTTVNHAGPPGNIAVICVKW
jgi:hypothetical protein